MEVPFRNGIPAPLPESLWAAVTKEGGTYSTLTENTTCDVGIIGAGFMGLVAALKLAENGKSVMLLEASDIGWGASGRNNGLVAPGLKRDPHEALKILGQEAGERLNRFSGNAPARLFDLIGQYDIDCDANHRGWIQAAHSRFAVATINKRMQQWRERGADVNLIDAADLEQRLGTGFYHGAWIDNRGGSLNPLAFVRGLARSASSAGARIHCGSPVLEILRGDPGWTLRSTGGSVSCKHVLICTNAYGQLKQTHAAVMPLRTAQVATRPLSDAQLAAILPGGESASDTHRLLTSFRITADKRLIMGGASATAGDEHPALFKYLHRAAAVRFPQLGSLQWEYGWSGYLALTPDHLPVVHKHDDGIFAAIGCNGRGIAMATAVGELLAELADGGDEKACPIPIRTSKRFHGYSLRRPGVAMAVRISRAMDTLERWL